VLISSKTGLGFLPEFFEVEFSILVHCDMDGHWTIDVK